MKPEAEGAARPRSVLAIDDNVDNLIALEAVMGMAFPGTALYMASTGSEGISIATARDPDLILLDILMPGMDGYEVCRRLKSDARTDSIPVVFLTAQRAERRIRLQALEAGAGAFLTKPIDEIELTAVIRAMTSVKIAADERKAEKENLASMVAERTRDLEIELAHRRAAESALQASESKYRAIFENMTSGCCIDEIVYEKGLAVDYRILDINLSFERILGIPAGRASTVLASELYGTKPPPNLEVFARVAETGEGESFETYFAPAGKFLHISVGRPGPGMFSTVFTDITERKIHTEKLRESESALRKAQEVANVGSWTWRIATDSLECSDQMYRIFGLEPGEGELVPRDVFGASTHPEDRAAVEKACGAVLEGKRPNSIEYRIVLSDARVRTIRAEAGELVLGGDGRPSRLSGVIQDISERVRIEGEIRQLNSELERRVRDRTSRLEAANRELDAFSYAVSHDLRTPLRALDGFSEALKTRCRDILDGQSRHYLDRIQEASDHMSTLIGDLLNLSQITRKDLVRQRIDFSRLARQSAKELSSRDGDRVAVWRIMPDIAVQGDPHLLKIALDNLLGNAWKYSAMRDSALIEVGRMALGEEEVLYVRDNGAGFDMAVAEKLFTPFQRLHSAKIFPGSGIGLSTVKRIITRHGGRIWAEAEVDKGACFYFTLEERS
jgi:PAS domain S-box-containing protein